MVTGFYGILLLISFGVIIYMLSKGYKDVDVRYWTNFILVPIIIMGYWLNTRVTTSEGAAVCYCIIYLDSSILFMLLLFDIVTFLKITANAWIKIFAYIVSFIHLSVVWFCFNNKMYFDSITVTSSEMGSVVKTVAGPLKAIHWIYIVSVIFVIALLLILAFIRKGTYSRRRMWFYAFIAILSTVTYFVQVFVQADFSLLPFVYVVIDIFVAVNYDYMHMHDITSVLSEHQASRGTKGLAVFDLNKRLLICNQNMYEFLPEMENQVVDEQLDYDGQAAKIFYDLIDDYKYNSVSSKKYEDGDRICKCEISEISLTQGGKTKGYLFEIMDVTEEEMVLRVMNDYNSTLASEVEKKTASIKDIQRKVVLSLANLVENRDDSTGGHVKRTSDVIGYIVKSAQKLGKYDIDDVKAEDIVRAAPMHDLGKITIEYSILAKPGKLTAEEYNIMKTHSARSGDYVKIILKDVEEKHFVDVAYNVARFHHERWDGKGYPEGRIGETIPLEARIMAIADVYDALVSKRCYKEALSFEDASKIMLEGMGTQFDPNMYDVFLDCREELEAYYKAHPSALG